MGTQPSVIESMGGVSMLRWNLRTLVETSDVDDVFLSRIIERGILTDDIVRNIEDKTDKRKFPYSLFLEIDKQGMKNVEELAEVLAESGNLHGAQLLDSKYRLQQRKPCGETLHRVVDNNVSAHNTSLITRINNMTRSKDQDKVSEDQENKETNEKEKKPSSEVDAKVFDTNVKGKDNMIHIPEILHVENDQILQVKVVPATKYFVDSESIYEVKSNFRGLAVIINNDEFTDPDYNPRQGSQVDVQNLRDLFTQLGFTVVVHRNLTRRETLNFVIDCSSDPVHVSADMMIFCFATHGPDKNKLISTDCLEIDVDNDILRSFNNENCPNLRGKPKFFIFQACQGFEKDYGVEAIRGKTQEDAFTLLPKTGAGPPGSPIKDPAWEDKLIAYATLPGFVSYRDIVSGTWFIQCLCQVFMERSCGTSLRDMLDMVARMLKKKQTETGAKQSFKYDVIHFYKKLYFHPGLPPASIM